MAEFFHFVLYQEGSLPIRDGFGFVLSAIFLRSSALASVFFGIHGTNYFRVFAVPSIAVTLVTP